MRKLSKGYMLPEGYWKWRYSSCVMQRKPSPSGFAANIWLIYEYLGTCYATILATKIYHLIAGTSMSTTGCSCSALLSLTSENIDAIENITFQYGENVPSLSSPYSYTVLVPLSESKLYTTSLERRLLHLRILIFLKFNFCLF